METLRASLMCHEARKRSHKMSGNVHVHLCAWKHVDLSVAKNYLQLQTLQLGKFGIGFISCKYESLTRLRAPGERVSNGLARVRVSRLTVDYVTGILKFSQRVYK